MAGGSGLRGHAVRVRLPPAARSVYLFRHGAKQRHLPVYVFRQGAQKGRLGLCRRSPMAGGNALRTHSVPVRVRPSVPFLFRRRGPTEEASRSRREGCEFDSRRRHQALNGQRRDDGPECHSRRARYRRCAWPRRRHLDRQVQRPR